MAIQFDDPSRVDIGSSRIRPRDVSQFQRGFGDNGAGDQMMQLAKSLEGLSGAFSALESTRVAEQESQVPLYVARIEAGFGSQATEADINDITSTLHPKVRQRVTEDYMSTQGFAFATAEMDKRLDAAALMSPEAEQAVYQDILREGLAKYQGNPLIAGGFAKGMQSAMDQRRASLASSRASEWQGIQRGAFRNGISMEADYVARGALVPQLSDAITQTAQRYQAPWLTDYLSRAAQIESGGGKNLVNPNSSARGPFQFITSTGKAYGLLTEADRMDFGKATDAAARLTMDNFNALRKSLGRDPTPGELYLAHQQGSGGAIRLLTSDARAADVVGMDAVRLNGGNPNMSAKEFAALWTKKFGDSAPASYQVASNDPNAVYLPPEAKRLQAYFFGIDGEYKVTGSLQNAERRDIAADTFLQKAIQYRDERFLMAMPENLMTPQIRDAYAKARDQISNLRVSDLRDQQALLSAQEAQAKREVTFEVINRRARGEQVNPYELAINPDGTLDPIKLAAATDAVQTGGNFMSDTTSKANAASLRQQLRNGFLTKNFADMPGLTFKGDTPSADEVRDYIQSRPDLNDAEKISLYETVDKELGVVAFLQDPTTEKWYQTFVEGDLNELLKSPEAAGVMLDNPALKGRVRDEFNLALTQYVEANGGVPPVDKKPMFDAAVAAARQVYQNAFNIGAPPANNNAQPGATDPTIDTLVEKYRTK